MYKNFFQPIIPLLEKTRDGGKIRRKYGKAMTPYHRIMADEKVTPEIKRALTEQYNALNPAQLKRNVTAHQDALYRAYQKKHDAQLTDQEVVSTKKLTPRLATFLIAEPMAVGQHSLIA